MRISQFAKSDFTLTPEKGMNLNFNKEGEDFLYQTKEILNFMNDEQKDGGEDVQFRNNETMFESFIEDDADSSYYKSQLDARVNSRRQTGSNNNNINNNYNNINQANPRLEKRISILDKDSLLTYLKNYSTMKYVGFFSC